MDTIKAIRKDKIIGGVDFTIYGTPEEPLFLAKDVMSVLEMDTSQVNKFMAKIDDDEKDRIIITTLGGDQEAQALTEDGFYEALMLSRKPIAKIFKKEVKLILKQIRKTGGYIPIREEETPEQFLARALKVADETLARKADVKNTGIIKMQNESIKNY